MTHGMILKNTYNHLKNILSNEYQISVSHKNGIYTYFTCVYRFFAFYFLLCYPSAVTPKQVVTLYNLFFCVLLVQIVLNMSLIINYYSSVWHKWLLVVSFVVSFIGLVLLYYAGELSIRRIENVLFICVFLQPLLIITGPFL